MARRLPTPRSREYERLIRIASRRYGVPGSTLAGLIEQESSFRPEAVSSAGAQGLTQFIPGTARAYGVRYGTGHGAVASQILGAAKYLKDLGYRKDPNTALGRYYGSVGASYKSEVLGRAKKYRWLDSGGAPGGGGAGAPLRRVSVVRERPEPGGQGVAGLLRQMQELQQPVQPSSPLTPPAFAAKAPLPKGYQELSSGGPPAPKLDVDTLLEAVKGLDQGGIAHSRVTGGGAPASGGGAPAPVRGRSPVKVAPGADRAGVPTSHFLQRVLSEANIPGGVTITTGSNHSQRTTSGNTSDHWYGKGADIGLAGDARQSEAVRRRGDLIAGRLLMRLGVPRAQARQMARRGGLFNIQHAGHRWQVIWKTNAGGNHFNHVHAGVR